MEVTVESYSGYKADERPARFTLGGHTYEVERVIDQWHGPDDTCFKVEASDRRQYILRCGRSDGKWTLDALPNPLPYSGP